MRKNITILILVLSSIYVSAQSVFVPHQADYYRMLDRYEIKSGKVTTEFFTNFKPYQRSQVVSFVEKYSLDSNQTFSKRDSFNLNYFKNDNWEWAQDSLQGKTAKKTLKYFYERKNSALTIDIPRFMVQVNPVAYFNMGRTAQSTSLCYINTRGAEIRGLIGKKLGFYGMIADNQIFTPSYVDKQIQLGYGVPFEGFWKTFDGGTLKNATQKSGYDFFTAKGYLSFNPLKEVNLQFGHDKNYIGNGYRSLLLSDFSSNYLFGKVTFKVWKFQYTNLYTELTGPLGLVNPGTSVVATAGNSFFPRKNMALHHLSINLGKHVNLGVMEAIMFNRVNGIFDMNYINPLIFYKFIENQLGSKDKAVIGADIKVNFLKRFSAYGQFLLNEFVFRELVNDKGWWGNKYAYQVGLKYIDAFQIKNLDLQIEYNFVRPFVYADKDSLGTYTDYNLPLAHPLGANFTEIVALANYQPINKLNIRGKLMLMTQGKDKDSTSKGGNILRPYSQRATNSEFGNTMFQGDKTTILYADLTFTYMLFHNFFLEFNQVFRSARSQTGAFNSDTYFANLGIRWNIGQRVHEF